jgi:hypothetical protein
LLGLAPLLVAGCMAGYAYPKLSYVPTLAVEAPPNEVWAFAVHCKDQQCLSLSASHEITLRPLPQERFVGPYSDLTLERGYWLWGGVRMSEHLSHGLVVRLYRRGCRTVEVGSWELFDSVRWVAAQNEREREFAIDDLFIAPGERGPAGDYEGKRNALASLEEVVAASTDPSHRQALLFAAGEYAALARDVRRDDDRKRLLDKARQLRERAGK